MKTTVGYAMQNKWRLLRGTWQDRGTITSSRSWRVVLLLERRFEVMERPSTETEENRLYEKLQWPLEELEQQLEESERSWMEFERQYEGVDWPRTEKVKKFELLKWPQTEKERQIGVLKRPPAEKVHHFEVLERPRTDNERLLKLIDRLLKTLEGSTGQKEAGCSAQSAEGTGT